MERLNWADYFMNIAVQVGLRSTCIRRKVGALIVKNNTIVSTGYNGSPKGLPNCSDDESRCYRSKHNIPSGEQLDKCFAVHAEINAIMQASKAGVDLEGAEFFVTTFPCSSCAKAIIQAGVKKIYYINTYENSFTKNMIEEAGVELIMLDGSIYKTPEVKGGSFITDNDLDSIDPLVQEIYKFEPGTEEFKENRHNVFIDNKLYNRYDEDIYAVAYNPTDEIEVYDERIRKKLLEHVCVKKRYELEYNGNELKQLVVGCIITNSDDRRIAVLESLNGRLSGKLTMIQGHVSCTELKGVAKNIKHYSSFIYDEIDSNMSKEIFEEVGLLRNMYSMRKMLIIQTNDNKISSEHVGVIYMVKIQDDNIFESLKSNEPEKHDVVKFDTFDLLSDKYDDRMDTWLKKTVKLAMKNIY